MTQPLLEFEPRPSVYEVSDLTIILTPQVIVQVCAQQSMFNNFPDCSLHRMSPIGKNKLTLTFCYHKCGSSMNLV